MSRAEKIHSTPEKTTNTTELESIADEQKEALRDSLEKAEKVHEKQQEEAASLEAAKNNAVELAPRTNHNLAHTDSSSKEKRRGIISRKQREESFHKQMESIAPHLSPNEQKFSRFIHNKSIEKTSDAIGSTIARPNALLAGSISAFILVAIIYLFAKHYGYPLSGFETIAAFGVGWIIGMIYDYIRLLIVGKK